MFTDSSSNIIYQVDTNNEEFHAVHTTSTSKSAPENVVFDPDESTFYWNTNNHQIWKMNLANRDEEKFIDLDFSKCLCCLFFGGWGGESEEE